MAPQSTLTPVVKLAPRRSTRIAPLEPGDELTRDEFERRYEAMTNEKKAELIEGVVHMPSPVRWMQHAVPHAELLGWLVVYRTYTPGVHAGDNGSLRLDMENEPQADAALIIDPANGGQVQLSADDFIVGAPELVAEVSSSTASIDMNRKLRIYRRNQVREYLVWRVLDLVVDWFVWRGGEFHLLSPDAEGIVRSEAFPGLWLDPQALVEGEMPRVLEVLQRGIASDEHQQFVEQLRQPV
ncbi:MAG: Uma2 family endonuclease [Planctomycetaceae bacterium]